MRIHFTIYRFIPCIPQFSHFGISFLGSAHWGLFLNRRSLLCICQQTTKKFPLFHMFVLQQSHQVVLHSRWQHFLLITFVFKQTYQYSGRNISKWPLCESRFLVGTQCCSIIIQKHLLLSWFSFIMNTLEIIKVIILYIQLIAYHFHCKKIEVWLCFNIFISWKC